MLKIYIIIKNSTKVYRLLEQILKNNNSNNIDSTEVLEILMKNYCLCDRTLVEGISKVPWMSIIEDSKLIQTELPLHKNIKL